MVAINVWQIERIFYSFHCWLKVNNEETKINLRDSLNRGWSQVCITRSLLCITSKGVTHADIVQTASVNI